MPGATRISRSAGRVHADDSVSPLALVDMAFIAWRMYLRLINRILSSLRYQAGLLVDSDCSSWCYSISPLLVQAELVREVGHGLDVAGSWLRIFQLALRRVLTRAY